MPFVLIGDQVSGDILAQAADVLGVPVFPADGAVPPPPEESLRELKKTRARQGDLRPLLLWSAPAARVLPASFVAPFAACLEWGDGAAPDSGLLHRIPRNGFLVSLSTATAFACDLAPQIVGQISGRVNEEEMLLEDIETALQESIANALIHGNLGILSSERGDATKFLNYSAQLSKRLGEEFYASRRIEITAGWDASTITIRVCDEGAGYEDTPAPVGARKNPYGRGLQIIRSRTLETRIENHGRRLVMVFRRRKTAQDDAEGGGLVLPAGMTSLMEARTRECRILVVDDDALSRALITQYLASAGFKNVEGAQDGVEALEKIKAAVPDLMVLDIAMPRMNGFELCRKLRADSAYKDLPILVETGHDRPEDRRQVFEAGATDMVTKPIFSAELIARIRIHLEHHLLVRDLRRYRHRVEGELRFARRMQEDILPSGDEIAALGQKYGVDLAVLFEPCSELGGDFWGALPIDDTRLGFYVADFTGHGVTSALNTFRLHALLQEMKGTALDPAAFLSSLNVRLAELLPTGQFATMCYGVLDVARHTLTYAGAGAPSPIVGVRGGAELVLADAAGLFLGISAKASYTNHTLDLLPGGMVFLYSDALIETAMNGGKHLGEKGLLALLQDCLEGNSAKRILSAVTRRFYDELSEPLGDDLTALCLFRPTGNAAP